MMMPAYCQRATVVGDGAMGTLCASMLVRKGLKVTLWGISADHIAVLQRDRENKRYLPGYRFDAQLELVHEPERAFREPDLIVSAVPTQFMHAVWTKLRPVTPRTVPMISVAKGLELETLRLPSQILVDCLGDVPCACMSGPCIAPEVAAGKPATVVAAGQEGLAELVQRVFSSQQFRVYTSRDLLGVEIAGAVKNVIALAAGICDGIGAGDNAKASLLTRGLTEIARLGTAMGAEPETFYGLAGVGDLFTTCVSRIGRNRSAGEAIGRGQSVAQVYERSHSVVEGIPTTRAVMSLARQQRVDMPIVEAVGAVLFAQKSPTEAIAGLMTRPLRAE